MSEAAFGVLLFTSAENLIGVLLTGLGAYLLLRPRWWQGIAGFALVGFSAMAYAENAARGNLAWHAGNPAAQGLALGVIAAALGVWMSWRKADP
jgi:hypothetical protein